MDNVPVFSMILSNAFSWRKHLYISLHWFAVIKSQSQSQKCFIAIQEKVYIDQNNNTEAHSGLFVPLIW